MIHQSPWRAVCEFVITETLRSFDEIYQEWVSLLQAFLDDLLSDALPDDWREQLDQFLAETEALGLEVPPESLRTLEELIESHVDSVGATAPPPVSFAAVKRQGLTRNNVFKTAELSTGADRGASGPVMQLAAEKGAPPGKGPAVGSTISDKNGHVIGTIDKDNNVIRTMKDGTYKVPLADVQARIGSPVRMHTDPRVDWNTYFRSSGTKVIRPEAQGRGIAPGGFGGTGAGKGPKDGAKKAESAGGEAEGAGEAEATQMHHPFPKYLRGAVDQTLAKMPKSLHYRFHAAIDKFKGGIYARVKGAKSFTKADTQKIIKDLTEFYETAEGGIFKKYLPDFLRAVKESGF